MKKKEPNLSEPYYYIALILKGSEKQYINLLKYIDAHNGANVIYQCKSLTYLHVTREDGINFKVSEIDPVLVSEHKRSERP